MDRAYNALRDMAAGLSGEEWTYGKFWIPNAYNQIYYLCPTRLAAEFADKIRDAILPKLSGD